MKFIDVKKYSKEKEKEGKGRKKLKKINLKGGLRKKIQFSQDFDILIRISCK